MMKRMIGCWMCIGLLWGLSGCTDDTVDQNNATAEPCSPGEVQNPITGVCQPSRVTPDMAPGTGDQGVELDADTSDAPSDMLDMAVDMPRLPPDMPQVIVDLGSEEKCKRGIDSDGDGLDNACECALGTLPGNSDSDNDGLPDGFEDANGNCKLDPGETQATVADTDSDGISDGDEVRAGLDPLSFDSDSDGIPDGVEFGTCLDPTKPDTDGDGIDDGVEDANKDGKIGICPERMYAPTCAQGEYDPCKVDTDGDGEEDGEEVNFLGCRPDFLQAIPTPKLITNQADNFQLAISQQAQSAAVNGTSAHVFNHDQAGYAGFISPVTVGVSTVEQMRDLVLTRVRSQYPGARFVNNGRRTVSHDGFEAVVSVEIDLASSGRPDQARDFALSGLLAVPSVSHSLTGGNFSVSNGNLTLIIGVVQRSNNGFLITGAIVSDAIYEDATLKTGFLVDDVTSAGSVATFSEQLENACVAYRVDNRPRADFIWIVDGSGSMSDENALVKNYADSFVQILSASNLDWRLGVVSSNCSDIANDVILPADVRGMFGPGGMTSSCPPPFGGFSSYRLKNGMLCDKNNAFFTTDPQKFKDCIAEVGAPSGISFFTEHTMTIAPAAIARALPRVENNPQKLRPNAATILISVTDEFDDYIQSQMGWRDAGGAGEAPNDPTGTIDFTKLDMVVQPFVDYLRRAESAATAFGIFWVPGQSCPGASEAAAGIERVVNQTGGTSGNICAGNLQTTLAGIAQASAGLASGLRVEGIPVADTMGVRVGDVSTQMIVLPTRSRQQGWDYDAVTNAVSFFGVDPPQTSDRVVITYKRWVNSVNICTSDEECSNGFQKAQCIDGVCRGG